MENLELKLKYPKLSMRRYSVVFYYPSKKRFVPVESVFLGNILATPFEQLSDEMKLWHQNKGLPPGYELKQPLIDFNRRYGIDILVDKELGKRERRVKPLFEFTPEQILDGLLTRVKRAYGEVIFITGGGEETFMPSFEEGPRIGAHAGDIVLSGYVRAKMTPTDTKPKFESVTVAGAFGDSKEIYSNLYGQSEDFIEAQKKQGYSGVQLLDTNIAALLYFTKKFPDKVKNFDVLRKRRRELTIFLPFYSERAREATVDAPYIVKGKQPPLLYLKWSMLMHHFFNGASFYELGKIGTAIQPLYHPILEDKINDGEAGFEGLAHSYPFSYEKLTFMKTPLRTFFERMLNALQRQGFKLNGYAIEKKGSQYEIPTIEFVRDDEIIRVLLSSDYPPIQVRRRKTRNPVEIFKQIDISRFKHPYAELFEPRLEHDDKTRRVDEPYEAVIPTDFDIPREMWYDCRAVVHANFPGGADGLKRRLFDLDIPKRSKILRMLAS